MITTLHSTSTKYAGVDSYTLAKCIMLHVLGVDDAYTCQRKFKDLLDEKVCSAQKFRLSFADSCYVHVNLKFFGLNVLRSRLKTDSFDQHATTFDIAPEDRALLLRMFEDRSFRSEAVTYCKQFDAYAVSVDSFKSVFDTFKNIYPELLKHIKRKTYTKLRFLSTSSNMEFYDFHGEFICKTLQAYMKMVPTTKSELHITNALRTAINNHAINIIKANTTQKRARLIKGESDGFGGNRFEMITVSENQLIKAFGIEDTVSYETLRNEDDNFLEESLRDSHMNFNHILQKFGKTYKELLFIKLLAVQENFRFSRYLELNNLIKPDEDNVDYNSRVGDDAYFATICAFLGVNEHRAKRFANKIGELAYPEKSRST